MPSPFRAADRLNAILAPEDPTALIIRRARIDLDGCPRCGGVTYSKGRRGGVQPIIDAPQGAHPVVIECDFQRGRCLRCGVVKARHPDQYEGRGFTRAFAEFVVLRALERSNLRTAKQAGVSENLVRDLARLAAQRLDAWFGLPAPRYLGMDEAYDADGKNARLTLVDLSTSGVLLVDRGRRFDDVLATLRRMRGIEDCHAVVMDFWAGYAKAVNALRKELGLPPDRLVIVVDPIHVLRRADKMLIDLWNSLPQTSGKGSRIKKDEERKLLLLRRYQVDSNPADKAMQDEIFSTRPILRPAWILWEWLHSIYDLGDKKRALTQWHDLVKHLEKPHKPELNGVYKAMRRVVKHMRLRQEHVFAYWDVPLTNNKTEQRNRTIDALLECGGYSDLMLNAKLRLQTGTYTPTMVAQALAGTLPPEPPRLEAPAIAPRRGTPLPDPSQAA